MAVLPSNRDKQWGHIVARAWADDTFRSRLLSDPGAVLLEHGLEVPAGARVKVLQDTTTVCHSVLPPSPAGDLSDEELSPVAGADSHCGCGRCGRCGCGCDH